jgi:hypothetical protein
VSDYETRMTRFVVLPKDTPLFSRCATMIEIDDEGGGEYLVISQHPDAGSQRIKIDRTEWPDICKAIDRMIAECR